VRHPVAATPGRTPGHFRAKIALTSFFVNHCALYFQVPAQAGYGDKWPSQ